MKIVRVVETTIDIDCRATGGPLIPKGSRAVVKIVRKTGELWVAFLPTASGDHFGHRHVAPGSIIEVKDG